MGFFSWKTSDTGKSITNRHSTRGPLPVFLITPENKAIREDNYEGYGIFGGQDAYVLLAKWNRPKECTGDMDHDRELGIDLAFGKDSLEFPLKFAEVVAPYEFLEPSESCENQGYFFSDDDEDEDPDDQEDDED